MKKIVTQSVQFVLLVLCLIGGSFGQDTIHISSDAFWDKDTIEIERHIVVDSGVTLTIEAGAYIEFQGLYGLFIYGTLLSEGVSSDSIVFTAADINTGWSGISFDSTSIENDSSSISYCIFEYGNVSSNGGALEIVGFTKIKINNCVFRNNSSGLGGALYANAYIVIKNSLFENNSSNSSGGGVFSDDSLKIISSTFRNNSSRYRGGGIACYSNLKMEDCLILGNSTGSSSEDGGGIYSIGVTLLEDCKIFKNKTADGRSSDDGNGGNGGNGGGIYCNNELTLINCEVDSNSTGNGGSPGYKANGGNGGNGGGIYAQKITLIRCSVVGNNTGEGGGLEQYPCQSGDGGRGGGVFASNKLFFIHSFIYENSTGKGGWCKSNSYKHQGSGGDGGGIYIHVVSNSEIINSVICNNIVSPGGRYNNIIGAHGIGSAIRIGSKSASLYITNSTFSNNNYIGSIFGGSINDLSISNCIFWDSSNINANVTFSTVKYDHSGIGNISADPSFVDFVNKNWSLSANSPCINAGTPDTIGLDLPPKDMADNPRVFDGIIDRIDMGAYEYQGNPTVLVKAGDITVDETWYTDTVKVVGDVTILNGVTLTINPGVYVEFQGNYNLNVKGRLLAEGIGNDSIIFTIHDTTGFTNTGSVSGGWHGIRFDSTSALNDSSKILFCRIEYCKSIGTGDNACGGALFVKNFSKLLLEYTSIYKCMATKGGGIYCSDSSRIAIGDCRITNNLALQEGGGVWCENSNPLIKNTTIERNNARVDGGGIWCNLSNLSTENTLITGNNASKDGGGICCWRSISLLVGNLISGNTADTGDGGGIFCDDNTSIRLINNTVTKNIAVDGDGIYGGIGCNVVLINSIFWNYPDNNDIFAFKLGCTDSIVYSDIEGGYTGVGNIALYPSFKDTTRGDWALYSNSPCINTANPDTTGLHLPPKDIAGNTRIHGGRVDIGAYEFKYSGPELVNPISDLVTNEDTTEILYSNLNTVFKDYKAGESLSFSVLSNTNPTLVTATVKADSVLSLVFASNASGVAGVVIKAINSVDSMVYDTFTITVNPVNDPPSFTNAGNITGLEDAGLQTITGWGSNVQTGPANESTQTVTFAVTNSNPQIFSTQPAIDIAGTITCQAAPDSFGVAILRIVCRDNGGTAWGGIDSAAVVLCTLTVQPVNDAPFFIINPMMLISATEDSGPYNSGQDWAVGIAGPVNERAQQVMHFVIKPLDMTLFAVQPAVDPVTGTLTFTPAPNVNGNTTASIQLRDNGGTANDGIDSSAVQNFTINITPVNDSPTLTTTTAQTIAEDNSLTILLSMTNASDIDNTLADTSVIIGAGANYTVVGNTITPAQNWNGVLAVPLQITDGKDTTSVVNLSVTVTAVNDAPTLTGTTPQTMLANDTLTLLISMVNAGDIDNTLTDASLAPQAGLNYTVSGNKIIPAANFIGPLTVGVKVTDGTLLSPAVNMTVTVEQAVAVITDTPTGIKDIHFAPNPVPVYANEVLLTIPSAMFTTGEVKIFDAMGNLIDESEINSSGGICYRWNLRNKNGKLVGTGTYLAILRLKSSDETTKIVRRFIGVSR